MGLIKGFIKSPGQTKGISITLFKHEQYLESSCSLSTRPALVFPALQQRAEDRSVWVQTNRLNKATSRKPLTCSDGFWLWCRVPSPVPEETENEQRFFHAIITYIFCWRYAKCFRAYACTEGSPWHCCCEKKTFKADTNRLQAHIRDELYDTAEPNNIKLPAPFWETTGHIYISCLLPST